MKNNTMKFTIKGELCDLNKFIAATNSNRYAGAAIKRDETQRCMWEIKKAKKGVVTRPVFIVYRWFCKNKRKDMDNVAFAKKFINDALVGCDILDNDGWNDISGWRDEFFTDGDNPRIEVILK